MTTSEQPKRAISRRALQWLFGVAGVLAVLLAIGGGSLALIGRSRGVTQAAPLEEIEVIGNGRFVQQVHAALELLHQKAPDEFGTVQRYVKRIEQGQHSGMWADRNPPTFELADRSAFYSVTWCAGAIAHDSYHSKLYHDYRQKHGEPVPYSIWGDSREKECLDHQLAAMQKMGAPKHEVDHVRSSDGSYADVNRDGKTDWEDYRRRDW